MRCGAVGGWVGGGGGGVVVVVVAVVVAAVGQVVVVLVGRSGGAPPCRCAVRVPYHACSRAPMATGYSRSSTPPNTTQPTTKQTTSIAAEPSPTSCRAGPA